MTPQDDIQDDIADAIVAARLAGEWELVWDLAKTHDRCVACGISTDDLHTANLCDGEIPTHYTWQPKGHHWKPWTSVWPKEHFVTTHNFRATTLGMRHEAK